jgi:hypothetical protein
MHPQEFSIDEEWYDTFDATPAFQYIQDLLAYLNNNYSDPTGADPFTTLSQTSPVL